MTGRTPDANDGDAKKSAPAAKDDAKSGKREGDVGKQGDGGHRDREGSGDRGRNGAASGYGEGNVRIHRLKE